MRLQDRWYKNGLIYEVSVRAFPDSNGDGSGDLRGLMSRLDYLAGLGVSCLWLLPFYPSVVEQRYPAVREAFDGAKVFGSGLLLSASGLALQTAVGGTSASPG